MFKLQIIFKITLLTFLSRKQLNAYCHVFNCLLLLDIYSLTLSDSPFSPRKIAGIIGNVSRHSDEPFFWSNVPPETVLLLYPLLMESNKDKCYLYYLWTVFLCSYVAIGPPLLKTWERNDDPCKCCKVLCALKNCIEVACLLSREQQAISVL